MGVSSTFIIDFKNSYRDKVGEDDFEKVMNHLSKLKLIVIWVNIKKQKLIYIRLKVLQLVVFQHEYLKIN